MSAEQEGTISYLPTPGLSYDPGEAVYWDEHALDSEVTRVFEVCHGCRMCFKYCDSFRDLFRILDDEHDGDVRKVTLNEREQVLDSCFQCKLCEVECPYTPRLGHEFQLNFPALVHRQRAQRHQKQGSSFGDRMLADPDGAGRLARKSFGLANTLNKVPLHRLMMEKVLGVHRDKLLPPFADQSFEHQAEAADRIADEPGGEAVLFPTCYVQNNEPDIGLDTLSVLDANQVDVRCTKGLLCCGMPAWEQGDLSSVQRQARANLDALEPFVDAGAKVLVVNPTCSLMLREEYPRLAAEQDRERAQKVAEATRDVSEYLWSLRKEERFNSDFKSSPAQEVAYHAPCHLRAQRVGFKGRDLVKKVPNTDPDTVMHCCGHDGTFAMRVDGFEISQQVGKKAFDGMKATDSKVWVTDCPLAALQFQQHAGVRPMHPMTVLARAYREDGFPNTEQDQPSPEGVDP